MLLGELSRNRYLGHYKEARSKEKRPLHKEAFYTGRGLVGAGGGAQPSCSRSPSLGEGVLAYNPCLSPGPQEKGRRSTVAHTQKLLRDTTTSGDWRGGDAAVGGQAPGRPPGPELSRAGAGDGGAVGAPADRGRPRPWQSQLEPTSCRSSARRPRLPPPGLAPASVSPALPARIYCWGTCLCCSLFSTSSSGSGTRF